NNREQVEIGSCNSKMGWELVEFHNSITDCRLHTLRKVIVLRGILNCANFIDRSERIEAFINILISESPHSEQTKSELIRHLQLCRALKLGRIHEIDFNILRGIPHLELISESENGEHAAGWKFISITSNDALSNWNIHIYPDIKARACRR
ncbi:hypothetical protein PFISCL1PPCAC_20943, partial [Pristionchus fissidentatus]